MLDATDEATLAEEADDDIYLDMPDDTYNAIVQRSGTGKNGKKALFLEFLRHHPYPRWENVIKLLQSLEKQDKAPPGCAEEVKENYLPSEYLYLTIFPTIAAVNISFKYKCVIE